MTTTISIKNGSNIISLTYLTSFILCINVHISAIQQANGSPITIKWNNIQRKLISSAPSSINTKIKPIANKVNRYFRKIINKLLGSAFLSAQASLVSTTICSTINKDRIQIDKCYDIGHNRNVTEPKQNGIETSQNFGSVTL